MSPRRTLYRWNRVTPGTAPGGQRRPSLGGVTDPQDHHITYTYDEAAEMLQISPRTLRRAVVNGRVPYRRIGQLVRFTSDDISEILQIFRVAPLPRNVRSRHR